MSVPSYHISPWKRTTSELRSCMNREMDLGSLSQPPYLINYTVSVDIKHHRIERTTSYCVRTVKQTAPHSCRNFALVSSYKISPSKRTTSGVWTNGERDSRTPLSSLLSTVIKSLQGKGLRQMCGRAVKQTAASSCRSSLSSPASNLSMKKRRQVCGQAVKPTAGRS